MTYAKFVKFTMQPQDNQVTKYIWVRADLIVSFQSMTYTVSGRVKNGTIIQTATNAYYVAHSYTDTVNLIKGEGVLLAVGEE